MINYSVFLHELDSLPKCKGACGIELIDKNKDFEPGNIKWVNKMTRKPISTKRVKKNKRTPKHSLSFTIEEVDYQELLKISNTWVIPHHANPVCSITDLMRDIIKTFLSVCKTKDSYETNNDI